MKTFLAILLLAAWLPCLAQPDAEVKFIVVKGNMAGCPSPDVLVIEAARISEGQPVELFDVSISLEWPPDPQRIMQELRTNARDTRGNRPGISLVEVLGQDKEPLYRAALKELYRNLHWLLKNKCGPYGTKMPNADSPGCCLKEHRSRVIHQQDYPDVPTWQLEEDLEELISELRYRNVIGPVPEGKANIGRDSHPDS